MMNWYFGWCLILTAFITGAILGLFFHRDDFLGGYASFRRRIVRLGHIAMAALGMINVLYALSFPAPNASLEGQIASIAFVVGGVSMPAVCFLTGWKSFFRYIFFIPVASLIVGVIYTLKRGMP
jgi:hypothetical protein